MPEVISDTSPLQYLHQANVLHLLPLLYGRVLVPEAVAAELEQGRSLGFSLPDVRRLAWIHVEVVESVSPLSFPSGLGPGERDVMILASRWNDSLTLMDDARARWYARLVGIRFTGTLGVLLRAKREGHLETLLPTIDAMEAAGFFLTPATRVSALRLAGEA